MSTQGPRERDPGLVMPESISGGLMPNGLTPEQLEQRRAVFALRQTIIEALAVDNQITEIDLDERIRGDEIRLRVTNSVVPVEANGQKYFARAYSTDFARLLPGQAPKVSRYFGIIFDETEELPVVTDQYALVYIDEDGVLRAGQQNPRINNPEDVTFLTAIADQLKEKADFEATRGERQRAEQDALFEERQREQNRINRRRTFRRYASNTGVGLLALACVGGIIGGSTLAIKSIESDEAKFDKKEHALPSDGVRLAIGQTLPLILSADLVGRDDLSRSTVPDTGDIDFGSGRLRDVIVTSSKPDDGNNCVTVKYKNTPPLDSTVVVWTDFANPENGESRAGELSATNNLEGIKVCWTGQERNNEDDPRILIRQ